MAKGKDVKIDTSAEDRRREIQSRLPTVERGSNETGVVKDDISVTGRDGTFKG